MERRIEILKIAVVVALLGGIIIGLCLGALLRGFVNY